MTKKEQQNEAEPVDSEQPAATDDASGTVAEDAEAPAVRTTDTVARMIALLALLLVAGGIAGGYYLWQLSQKSVRLADFNSLSQRVEQQSQLNQKTFADLNAALQKQQQSTQQISTAMSQLGEQLGRNHSDWIIAEVEYLLSIANQRVLLQRDVSTAITALGIADKQLKTLADPFWYPVRQQISNEITALRAVPQIDRAGITTTLISLSDKVASLPIVHMERDSPIKDTLAKQDKATQQTGWQTRVQDFAWAVWQELKGLVRVRQTDEQLKPLLAPVSQQFLIQNLKLQLQSARLAVQQNEAVIYQQSLQTASNWINLYFDTEAAATISMLDSLKQLASVQISPDMPVLSGSLLTLRTLRDKRNAAATRTTDNKDKQQ